jgi:hypothetical protein
MSASYAGAKYPKDNAARLDAVAVAEIAAITT